MSQTDTLRQQLTTWHIFDARIIDLFLQTPRESFIPPQYIPFAKADVCIPLSHGQLMLTPKEDARIMQAMSIRPSDSVLEVGTGVGYITALLAKQAKQVESVDADPLITQEVAEKLAILGFNNVSFVTGNALRGWGGQTCYDAVWINGSLPNPPESLLGQLNIHGRLCVIVGIGACMKVLLFKRKSQSEWERVSLFEVGDVPLNTQFGITGGNGFAF